MWLEAAVPLSLQTGLLVGGVLLLGVPHGALDHLVARPLLEPRLGRWWWLPFVTLYLALTAATLMAWRLAPPLTLVFFLLLSVLHFGSDATSPGRLRWLAIAAHGVGPIVLPAVFHPAEVAAVFRLLTPGWAIDGDLVLEAAQPVAVLWTVAAGIVGAVALTERGKESSGRSRALHPAAELALLPALFALLPPLLGFAAYFCLLHSTHHLAEIAHELGPRQAGERWRWLLRQAWPLTAATGVLALAVAPWLTADLTRDEGALRIVFWGLAALTVPHMLLLAAWDRHRAATASRPLSIPREDSS